MHRFFSLVLAAGIFVAISLLAFPATAHHNPNHNQGGVGSGVIDCAAGQTISAALAAGSTNIVVLGTCDEAVEITTSNVTIEGHADGGAIIQTGSQNPCIFALAPTVLIQGAQNVLIKNLSITGLRHGLATNFSGSATIENSDVTGGCGRGVFIGNNSHLDIWDSVISNGASVNFNSTGKFFNTVVDSGLTNVSDGSRLRLYGTTLENLNVTKNSSAAIFDNRIDELYGSTTFNSFIGCDRYSILSTEAGASVDGSGVSIPLSFIGNDGLCSVTGF